MYIFLTFVLTCLLFPYFSMISDCCVDDMSLNVLHPKCSKIISKCIITSRLWPAALITHVVDDAGWFISPWLQTSSNKWTATISSAIPIIKLTPIEMTSGMPLTHMIEPLLYTIRLACEIWPSKISGQSFTKARSFHRTRQTGIRCGELIFMTSWTKHFEFKRRRKVNV